MVTREMDDAAADNNINVAVNLLGVLGAMDAIGEAPGGSHNAAHAVQAMPELVLSSATDPTPTVALHPVVESILQSVTAPPCPNKESNPRKRRRELTPKELKELGVLKTEIKDITEHLIVQGNHDRHLAWRMSECKRRRDELKMAHAIAASIRTSDNTTEVGANVAAKQSNDARSAQNQPGAPLKKRSLPGTTQVADIHAQDSRVYNYEKYIGNEPDPWPRPRANKAKANVEGDKMWNKELSDSIHPVLFNRMRLSGIPIHRGDNDPNEDLDPDQKSCNVSKEEAPRALLLQCWERAVHAAASTMTISTTSHSAERPAPHEKDDNGATSANETTKKTRDLAVAKCRSLEIRVPDAISRIDTAEEEASSSTFPCPSCGIQCTSAGRLDQHFFGTANTSGCCWGEIERKQRRMLANAMEAEVNAQAKDLLRYVLYDACQDWGGIPRAGPSSKAQLDCFDVLDLLDARLASAYRILPTTGDPSINSTKHLLETLEVDTGKSPLVMNKAVLEAVRRRVVDRYARVPR